MFKLLVIYISLLTCTPGQELYSRYGHTAIRVQDTEKHSDFVFNYGTFTFNTDHFYWKFVKGETYYQLGIDPTSWFIEENTLENRTVYEQRLNLTEEQTQAVAEALWKNFRPENRSYLYNFVSAQERVRRLYLLYLFRMGRCYVPQLYPTLYRQGLVGRFCHQYDFRSAS